MKKSNARNSKTIIVTAIGIILVIAACITFSVQYIHRTILSEYENNAVNTAKLISKNLSLSDEEVIYLRTLTFEELQVDPISARLSRMVTGIDYSEPVVSVYIVAEMNPDEVKYTLDDSNCEFWEATSGTKLDKVWLLNIGINAEGNERRDVSDDIYRYTVTTDELKELFENKTAKGTHTVDEWGDVISGYVPFYSTQGNFVGMFGVDFDVAQYNQNITKSMIVILSLLMGALCILVLLFVLIYRQYAREHMQKEQILETEKNTLSAILDHIQVGVYVYRFEGDEISVLHANSYIVNMLGRNPNLIKSATTGDMTKYVHPDDGDIVKELIKDLKTSGKVTTKEFRLMNKKTNEYMWVVTKGKGVKEKDGSIYAYVTYIDDTERKLLQDVENRLEIEKSANKAKTEFLSNMSHDMRTPMNGILGMTTLMLDEELPENLREKLNHIQMSGKYLLNLINDTLDVSKIEAKRLELHPVASDAYNLTANIRENARLMADEKGVHFSIDYVNQLAITPTVLYLDEPRVEQIFMNLISNAVKFTPSGGTVSVSIERIETKEDYIYNRYVIRDTGIGMSEEFLKHMTEPFAQEGRIHTNRENGTGLGLTIVYQLVELMGGKIQVESQVNVGTTFTLDMQFERYKGTAINKSSTGNEPIQLEGKRILLCEDHPINREIAVQLLEKKQMIVEEAEDGAVGVEKFQQSENGYYNLILMDIRMPILDGIEATKRIRMSNRADAKTIPIIAMTANAFEEDVENCLAAGMNGHLAKPIDVNQMYQMIQKYVNESMTK